MKLNEYMELNFKGLEISEKLEKVLNKNVIAYKDWAQNGRDTYYSILLDKTSFDKATNEYNNWKVEIKQTKKGLKIYLNTGMRGISLDCAIRLNEFIKLEV